MVSPPVLCQPATPSEPREAALDDPAAGQQFEAYCGFGAPDDLGGPATDFGEGRLELRSGMAAIGEDMTQPGKGMADLRRAGTSPAFRRRQQTFDQRPFRVRRIACISPALALIMVAGDLRPHGVPPVPARHKHQLTTH